MGHFTMSETGLSLHSLHDQYLALLGGPGVSQLWRLLKFFLALGLSRLISMSGSPNLTVYFFP